MKHAEIIFGLASQSFFYDPPELFRPSGTPTVQVFRGYDDDTATAQSATTGSCSVDSVNTTLSAAASVGDTSISLTSGTSVARDRTYLLTSAAGLAERVDVMGISGTTATLRQPLVNDYASGATFQGTRITISVLDTWAATTTNLTDALDVVDNDIRTIGNGAIAANAAGYRLRWAYTVNSIATIGVSYADLVRYQSKNLVSPRDVDRLFPGWIDRLPPDYRNDQGCALIDEAFLAVRLDALTDAQLVRRVRDTQVLSDLVKYRANLLAMQNDVMAGRRDTQAFTLAQDLYDRRYNALIREPKVAIDQSGGGANGEAIRLPAFRR